MTSTVLTWERHPHGMTHKASYQLFADGKRTNVRVQWCGHPTALWPYYVTVDGEMATQPVRSSRDAKLQAEAIYLEAAA